MVMGVRSKHQCVYNAMARPCSIVMACPAANTLLWHSFCHSQLCSLETMHIVSKCFKSAHSAQLISFYRWSPFVCTKFFD